MQKVHNRRYQQVPHCCVGACMHTRDYCIPPVFSPVLGPMLMCVPCGAPFTRSDLSCHLGAVGRMRTKTQRLLLWEHVQKHPQWTPPRHGHPHYNILYYFSVVVIVQSHNCLPWLVRELGCLRCKYVHDPSWVEFKLWSFRLCKNYPLVFKWRELNSLKLQTSYPQVQGSF